MILLFRKKQVEPEKGREELLNDNEGVPFSVEMVDSIQFSHLMYNYENVECSIMGDTSGLKEGAILYVRRNGILANVVKEQIAQIKNKKLQLMVTDFFEKDKFSMLRARFCFIEKDSLYCNLGFYIDDDPDEELNDD